MADGLLSRILPGHTPQAGRERAYSTIPDLARRIVQRALGGLHTTSEFASTFGESFNQALLTLRVQPSPAT